MDQNKRHTKESVDRYSLAIGKDHPIIYGLDSLKKKIQELYYSVRNLS